MADEAFRIDNEGHLRPLQFLDTELGIEDSSPNPEESNQYFTANADESQQVITTKTDLKKDLVLDREVYRTYFGTISRTDLILFFVLGLIFAFSLKFPGVSTYHHFSPACADCFKMSGSCFGPKMPVELIR